MKHVDILCFLMLVVQKRTHIYIRIILLMEEMLHQLVYGSFHYNFVIVQLLQCFFHPQLMFPVWQHRPKNSPTVQRWSSLVPGYIRDVPARNQWTSPFFGRVNRVNQSFTIVHFSIAMLNNQWLPKIGIYCYWINIGIYCELTIIFGIPLESCSIPISMGYLPPILLGKRI